MKLRLGRRTVIVSLATAALGAVGVKHADRIVDAATVALDALHGHSPRTAAYRS